MGDSEMGLDSPEGTLGNPRDVEKVRLASHALDIGYSDAAVAARLRRLGRSLKDQPSPTPVVKGDPEFSDAVINQRLERLKKKIQEEKSK
jgi:hypothetical protein